MRRDYGSTHEDAAQQFVGEHDPSANKASLSCKSCCPAPALAARFTLRIGIPIALGMLAGFGSKWLNETLDGPDYIFSTSDNNTTLEVSDVVSSCVTLLFTYGINWALNKCWPINPYNDNKSGFFPLTTAPNGTDLEIGSTAPTAT